MSAETTALLNDKQSGDPEWAQTWVKDGEADNKSPRQFPPPVPSSRPTPTQSDPSHPLKGGGGQRPPPSGNRNRSRPPSRNAVLPPPPVLGTVTPPGVGGPMPRKPLTIHRRAKSDVPLLAVGGGGSGSVTKAELLKTLPNPRWGGPTHRQRTSSDGGSLLAATDGMNLSPGYGSITGATGQGQGHPLLDTNTIGSVALNDTVKRPVRHARTMSDASVHSVTTNMANSALFRGVTAGGTLQLQLPKDDFRVLMDSQLEAGSVYKRKLVDNEDGMFVDYHTLEEGNPEYYPRYYGQEKRLPPDLYVMAVDSTLYRRMLDEIIDSKSMPCGTYFCGHHEDVRHPEVKIAVMIVFVVFVLLLSAAIYTKG